MPSRAKSLFSESSDKPKVLSLNLKTDGQSLIRAVCGSEFQTDGAKTWKARLVLSLSW